MRPACAMCCSDCDASSLLTSCQHFLCQRCFQRYANSINNNSSSGNGNNNGVMCPKCQKPCKTIPMGAPNFPRDWMEKIRFDPVEVLRSAASTIEFQHRQDAVISARLREIAAALNNSNRALAGQVQGLRAELEAAAVAKQALERRVAELEDACAAAARRPMMNQHQQQQASPLNAIPSPTSFRAHQHDTRLSQQEQYRNGNHHQQQHPHQHHHHPQPQSLPALAPLSPQTSWGRVSSTSPSVAAAGAPSHQQQQQNQRHHGGDPRNGGGYFAVPDPPLAAGGKRPREAQDPQTVAALRTPPLRVPASLTPLMHMAEAAAHSKHQQQQQSHSSQSQPQPFVLATPAITLRNLSGTNNNNYASGGGGSGGGGGGGGLPPMMPGFETPVANPQRRPAGTGGGGGGGAARPPGAVLGQSLVFGSPAGKPPPPLASASMGMGLAAAIAGGGGAGGGGRPAGSGSGSGGGGGLALLTEENLSRHNHASATGNINNLQQGRH